MTDEYLIKRDEDTGYIVAWKHKYDFQTGKFDDEMTYGAACRKCEELISDNSEKTFWPEKVKPAPEWHLLYS